MDTLRQKILIMVIFTSSICKSQSIEFEPIGDIDKPLLSFCLGNIEKKAKKGCYQASINVLQEIINNIKTSYPECNNSSTNTVNEFGSYRITVQDGVTKKQYIIKGKGRSCDLFANIIILLQNNIKLHNEINNLIKRLS
jgi:hypothetical protein